MPKILVQVMPKPELLDPAGKAVQRSLAAEGRDHLVDVRIGKRFEITTDREVTPELMEEISELAANLLSNDVIEDVVSIEVADDEAEFDPAQTETVTDDGLLPTGASSDEQARENVQGE
ncbi:phosphoribosylformylglycinamidine synthase subunit PurS [Gulosibacter sp. 10]|uniref:phosphoribosylformylglycinamidine synthase subunit PurS n=1 Tax=Gulosibacter sp. 10 TaxID=1255570 RepID=UPI00097EADE5|nr:Phosphoribosylformylglycinamidine synthase, PurS subunit [Gulosibacter sp. 10]